MAGEASWVGTGPWAASGDRVVHHSSMGVGKADSELNEFAVLGGIQTGPE